jgi:glycosyltransferase involved in cell wall biosynthesis
MKNNQAELLVVGDGTEKNRLIALAGDLGIAARSHFPGFIRWEAGLANIYRMATLFVTASEIETQGLVLLEAAACGLPIVAFKATCLPEIVKEGINGYLAAPDDLNGLVSYIQKLINDKELARSLGMAGHLTSRAFCLEQALSAHERIYLKTIARALPAGTFPTRTWQGRATRYDASD